MFCEGGEEKRNSMAEARRILYSQVGDEHYNLSSIFKEHPDKAVKFAFATFGIPQFCKDNWDGKKQSQEGKEAQPEAVSTNGGTWPPTNAASGAKPFEDNHSTDKSPSSRKRNRRPRARRKRKRRARKSTDNCARANSDGTPLKSPNGREFGTTGTCARQLSPRVKRASTYSDTPSRPQKRQRVTMQVAGITGNDIRQLALT
ncbi:hypothetical protein GGI42DRAFT_345924 [Trichoderma sp. SZMC 28013]